MRSHELAEAVIRSVSIVEHDISSPSSPHLPLPSGAVITSVDPRFVELVQYEYMSRLNPYYTGIMSDIELRKNWFSLLGEAPEGVPQVTNNDFWSTIESVYQRSEGKGLSPLDLEW